MITLNLNLLILSTIFACTLWFIIIGMIVGAVCFPEIQPPPPPEKDFDHDPTTRNS